MMSSVRIAAKTDHMHASMNLPIIHGETCE